MRVIHELTVYGRCPVNGEQDSYAVTVEATRIVKVEEILSAVGALPAKLFQERMTEHLAAKLKCRVTSVGYHSGVKTTCTI